MIHKGMNYGPKWNNLSIGWVTYPTRLIPRQMQVYYVQVQNPLDQSKKVFVIIFMDYLIKYSISFKSFFDEVDDLKLERPYSWGENMSNS